jgi:hypothetical protein
MTRARLLLPFLPLLFVPLVLLACDDRHRTPRTPRHVYGLDAGPNEDAAAPLPSFTAAPGDVQL